MTHTPGPWRTFKQADGTAWIVATEALDKFGRSCESIVRIPLDRNGVEANARLIAAAPDLLAACKALLSWSAIEDVPGPAVESARSAIAKAEGDPS